jgi:flagellar motor switch protein FliN/FliY
MGENELAKLESIMPANSQETVVPAVTAARPWVMRIEEHVLWSPLSRMTVATAAGIPLSGFKIGDLLRLAPGQIVESKWSHTDDIPLKAGRVQVAWTEFEVVDQHLMVRLTRLA